MADKKSWGESLQEVQASPIKGMSFTEYQIFAQQSAQEAFELGLAKRTPQNSVPMTRRDPD